ncbi:phosphopantetheine-binding protein [Nocardia sp. NPDC051570]|uniref:phosphopantetheine-binding protein n=1 Tax=Nocardia sp. NPDC051570 TaxID=3364324 RepID=UPI0037A66F8F
MNTAGKETMSRPDERELRELIAPLLDMSPEDISADANLILLGMSSIAVMRLVGRWRRGGLPVVFEELASTPTIASWLAHFDKIDDRQSK